MYRLFNGLKRAIFAIYGLWVWLVFMIFGSAVTLLLVIMPGIDARRKLTRNGAIISLALSGLRPRISGLELLPDEPGVVVANHASYLDGIVMTAILPARFQYVVKQEMSSVPLAGYLLKRIGTQFVSRAHAQSSAGGARRIMKAAKNQQSIVFFPEGTFVAEPGLKKFHSGAFISAASGEMPITPVVIHGTRKILPAEQWLARPGHIDVMLKSAHRIGVDAKDAKQLKLLCRQSILAELNEPDTAQS